MNSKDEALAKFDEKQRQRKMLNISVLETSGVDVPAHGVLGFAVMKAESNPLDPRSKEAIQARKKEHADKIKDRIRQIQAQRTGKPVDTKEFEDAVKELMASKKLTRAQAIAQLSEDKPDLVQKAREVLNAQQEQATVAKTEKPETAQDKILAKATELFQEGRAKSVASGVELATKLYPEIAEQALNETVNEA